MKSFAEEFEKIQQSIDSIEDENVRQKAQTQFDLMPRDINEWKNRII